MDYYIKMNFSAAFKSLCLPSKVYFVLAIVSILSTILAPALFGKISFFMHIIHIVYAVFWTWVLNLICKAGYKWISWVLVLAPFALVLLLVFFVLNDSVQPGSTPIIVLATESSL